MPKLITRCGKELKVDKDDYQNLKDYSWFFVGNRVMRFVYTGEKKFNTSLLRAIFPAKEGAKYEFLNGDTLDYRKQNLRIKQPLRPRKIDGMDSKWSAFKEKLLCKSSSAATS